MAQQGSTKGTASKKGGRQDTPYNFPEPVERAIAYLACTNPRFMQRAAHELRSDLLTLPDCKHAVEAAQSIFREAGRGPTHPTEVIGYVALRRDEGKLTQEEVRAVQGLFDIYDSAPMPEAAATEELLVKVLRKRLRHAIAQAAVAEYNEEDWEQLHEMLRREEALGTGESGLGITTAPEQIIQVLRSLRSLQRVPLGIECLDEALGKGAPWGTLTCFMAGPGGAKSMTMSHISARLAMRQLQVAYGTLELPPAQVTARIAANQTGITIDELAEGVREEELVRLLKHYNPAPVIVQDFTPHATTPDTLINWCEDIKRRTGRRVDALVIDYADKLTATGKVDEKGTYQEMRIVYERVRIYCDAEKVLGITASQSRARDEKKAKVIDLEHTADSMHKARVVDQFVTLNFDDNTKELTFFVAKSRYSEGRKTAGPVPTNFACGQVAPVDRQVVPAPAAPRPVVHREPGDDSDEPAQGALV